MISIQEYGFEVEHIKGVDNKVADALSRLCGLRRDVKHGPKKSNLEKKEKGGTNNPCSRRKAISKAQRKKGKNIP